MPNSTQKRPVPCRLDSPHVPQVTRAHLLCCSQPICTMALLFFALPRLYVAFIAYPHANPLVAHPLRFLLIDPVPFHGLSLHFRSSSRLLHFISRLSCAEAYQLCSIPFRGVSALFKSFAYQGVSTRSHCGALLFFTIAKPGTQFSTPRCPRRGGEDHSSRSSSTVNVNRPLPLFRHWPKPLSLPYLSISRIHAL